MAVILVAILLVGSAFGIWGNRKIDLAWEFLERRVAELSSEARSRRSERAVLQGVAVPGNAWEDYGPAVTQSNRIQKPDGSQIIYCTLRKYANEFDSEEKAFQILDSLHPQFEALRRGARRSSGVFAREWDSLEADAFGMSPDKSGKPLAWAALLEARRLLRAGRAGESLELLLAALQLGSDMGRNGTIVNEILRSEVLTTAGEELARLIQGGRFTPEQLLTLARSLKVLDTESVQPEATLRNHLLMQGEMILHDSVIRMTSVSGRAGPRADAIRPGWRHLYSTTLLRAAAFSMVDRACEQLATANAAGYSGILKVKKDLRSEFERSHNEFAEVMLNDYAVLFVVQRRWMAQLRLVRLLAHYRATGEVLHLDDPLERIIRPKLEGSRLLIWIDGPDRKELLYEVQR